jgi:hypothetical protein
MNPHFGAKAVISQQKEPFVREDKRFKIDMYKPV